MPGGVVLGVDEKTCEIDKIYSTQAVFHFFVPAAYVNNVFTIKISWPDDGFRGLRASTSDQVAQIALKGIPFWKKRAFAPADNGFFYAARSEPVLLTIVPRQSGDHSIEINLPAGIAWDIGSIQLSTSPLPQNLLGVAYSPYRDCQDVNTSDQPTLQNITFDFYMLRQAATAIRTYSSTGVNSQIPKLAKEMGIPIYAGAWLDGNRAVDDEEMRGIADIAQTTQIEAAIIGNEYHLRHWREPGDLSYLLSRIQEFKSAYPEVPVGTAEIDSFVFEWPSEDTPMIKAEFQPILDQIDILFIHIYPFWSGMPVDGAAAYTVQRYQAIKSLLEEKYHGTKRVIIGEAGWPSAGQQGAGYGGSSDSGVGTNVTIQPSSVFHPESQRKYMIELIALAHEQNVDLFFFTSFDELWKTEGTDGVGRSWGSHYADRTSKYNFSGLLLPPELLPAADGGDVFRPYTESDFTWSAVGTYPIYTEWPSEPKGKPADFPQLTPFSLAYMGDETSIDVFQCERRSHSGETAIRVTYQPEADNTEQRGWSGAYWLYPENNWGTIETGENLSEAQTISFWARGDSGIEVVEFVTGGICGAYDGKTPPLCPDTIQPKISTGPIHLTTDWQKYTLDLSNVERSNIIGAFGFAVNRLYNPSGATFYLDDIAFSPDAPATAENVYPEQIRSTFNIYTDYTALDNHYIPSNFMGDAVDPDHFSLSPDWSTEPYSGQSSIKISYSGGSNGWAGVYWTDPENNWGQRPGGYDLTGVTSLTFWAKSEDYTKLQILIGGINCYKPINFPYHDSVCNAVPLSKINIFRDWEMYTIDLSGFQRDWSRLLGGFGFVTYESGTFYLDDIIYHFDK
jgi:exo-beta-1,3-glucanase (GH17 family)